MGWAVLKVDDNGEERFLVWSSVVDAPLRFAMTADELTDFVIEDATLTARNDASAMIDRAGHAGHEQ